VLTACGPEHFPRPAPLDDVSPLDDAAATDHWLSRPLS